MKSTDKPWIMGWIIASLCLMWVAHLFSTWILVYPHPYFKREAWLMYLSILSLLIHLIGMLSTIWLLWKYLWKPLRQTLEITQGLAKGNYEQEIRLPEDKLNQELASALNDLTYKLQFISNFIQEIGRGNLDVHLPLSDQTSSPQRDQLFVHLAEMQKNLSQNSQKEKQRNWKNEGTRQVNEVLRKQEDLENMAKHVLSVVAKYLEAHQGGIYLSALNTKEEPCLQLLSTYAFDQEKYRQKEVMPQEGLLGQVYQDAALLYIEDLPQGYSIQTGLGRGSPRSLAIVPLRADEEVEGVLELSFIHQPKDYELAWLDQIGETIGNFIYRLKNVRNTQALLKEAQVHEQLLRLQGKELREHMTKLQATQEETTQREKEMKEILTAMSTAILSAEYDMEGNLLSANENFLIALGGHPKSWLGVPYDMLIPASENERTQTLWKHLANGQAQKGEYEYRNQQGQALWFSASFTPMLDEKGQPYKVIQIAQDITQQKQQASEFEKLSLVADNTSNSVVITDTEGKIEYVNQGFEKMTGYRSEEVLGRKPGHFLQGADTNQTTVGRIRQKLDQGAAFYEEILNYHKSGMSYWISLAINPVLNTKGQIEHFVSVQADITQTKLKALDYQCKLEAVAKFQGVVEMDLSGRILACNDIFAKMLGYEKEELIHQYHSSLVSKDDKEGELYQAMWQKIKAGYFVSDKFKRIHKSGREIWLKGSYSPVLGLDQQPYKVINYTSEVSKENKPHEKLAQILDFSKGFRKDE